MPLSNEAKFIQQVNEKVDKALCRQADGTYRPYVCIICDKILKPSALSVIKVEQLREYKERLRCDGFAGLSRDHAVVADYRYRGDNKCEWMEGLLLSPRASYLGLGRGRGNFCGYSACKSCKEAVVGNHPIPKYAIANKYYFGSPPDELLGLNDVELALLTPVKAYGFVFTYSGGKQRNLKGVVSYFRVKEYDIAKALMQLEVLGLNKHVVVLYTGEFTEEQRKKVKERSTIRVDKVLDAVRSLIARHRLWDKVDLDKIRKELLEVGPIFIDESNNVEGSTDAANSNIETTETFVAYFPDGTMKAVSGGQASIEAFKSLVERSKLRMDQLEFQCDLAKEAVSDFKDNNFVNACLLQFPYGLGGMNERRMKEDGSFSSSVNLTEYVRHLSLVSQSHFHRPLFVLILYSIYQRQRMLKSASLNVRGEVNYSNFANALNADDIDQAVAFRQAQQERASTGLSGGPSVAGGTFLSNKYLNTIDAVTKAVPHSNAAARRARTEGECLCHYLGFPAIFLSFAPDDESSFLLQVYSGVTIDDDTPVESLTDEQLAARAKSRRELRIRSPGMCAFIFEIMLEIVLEEVIGVDMTKKKVLKEGFFGLVEAVMVTIEEQGRLSLHAHILLWIPKLKNLLLQAQEPSEKKRKQNRAKNEIADQLAACSTTNLIGNCSRSVLREVFEHECTSPRCEVPSVVDEQQLRNLRHRVGCAATDYVIAVCETCRKTWTHEEVVQSFLQKGLQIPGFGSFPDDCKRLNAMCVQYQKPSWDGANRAVVNAAYNTHFSFHTKSCFPPSESKKGKENKKKRKRKEDECRLRLPDLRRKRCRVNDTTETSWYSWDGTHTTKQLMEACPRRGDFDELQNVSCPVISESKLTCNSNIQIVAPGPIVVYTTKYAAKPTQKQDTENYCRAADVSRKMISNDRKHSDDKKEALRRILRASFAHNKANVVGPSMASWLTRNGSCFMISRDFAWCPLRDIEELLRRASLSLTLRSFNGVNFFENQALHYLCRPSTLKHVNVFAFYTDYKVRYNGRRKKRDTGDENEVVPFENTGHFVHSSFKKKTQHMAQGVRRREESLVLKLHQWYFPDAAKFDGSILDEETPITSSTEHYARLVLMLFYPFRCDEDLRLTGSHTRRLRWCVKNRKIESSSFEYLQNVQDGRSNALRCASAGDELAQRTVPFQAADDGLADFDSEEDSDDDDDESDDEEMCPSFLDEVINNVFFSNEGFDDENKVPTDMNFSRIMEKGSKQCGFDKVVDVATPSNGKTPTWNGAFVRTQEQRSSSGSQEEDDDDDTQDGSKAKQKQSRQSIVNTVMKFKTLRSRSFPTFGEDDEPVDAREANGTATSIIDWARKAKLDKNQARTFEILASTFVLTFYDEAFKGNLSKTRNARFLVEYRKLNVLSGRSAKKENLVGFVHGPGGSGKSAVIDLVMLYGREYCGNIDVPFTSETIVLTALTGVAATVIRGETTHRAAYIYRTKEFNPEEVESWKEARLLIVDEVSFAAPSIFETLDGNLRTLQGRLMSCYGGLNIVFSGDLRQLKPCKNPSLCDVDCPQFDDFMNCYIELEGKHRFKNDPNWGDLLFRFRNGVPTMEDIREINNRVCCDDAELPGSLRYATHTNRDRDAINTAVFAKYCSRCKDSTSKRVRSAVIVLSDNLRVKNGKGAFVAVKQRRNFWQSCGEDDVRCKDKKNGRVDPVLKLYRDCPVMLTSNDNVKAGRANGTRAYVQHVMLKRGENHFDMVVDDCVIPAVFASQVDHVQLRHENDQIQPQVFPMKPRQYSINAYLPRPGCDSSKKKDKDRVEMRINQLPITSNIATTGHKLQGCGVDDLFMHGWYYDDNWPYVVLSRTRTLSGLYLREPLLYDMKKYAMLPSLKKKMEGYRREKMRPVPSQEQYKWMENCDSGY